MKDVHLPNCLVRLQQFDSETCNMVTILLHSWNKTSIEFVCQRAFMAVTIRALLNGRLHYTGSLLITYGRNIDRCLTGSFVTTRDLR